MRRDALTGNPDGPREQRDLVVGLLILGQYAVDAARAVPDADAHRDEASRVSEEALSRAIEFVRRGPESRSLANLDQAVSLRLQYLELVASEPDARIAPLDQAIDLLRALQAERASLGPADKVNLLIDATLAVFENERTTIAAPDSTTNGG